MQLQLVYLRHSSREYLFVYLLVEIIAMFNKLYMFIYIYIYYIYIYIYIYYIYYIIYIYIYIY